MLTVHRLATLLYYWGSTTRSSMNNRDFSLETAMAKLAKSILDKVTCLCGRCDACVALLDHWDMYVSIHRKHAYQSN